MSIAGFAISPPVRGLWTRLLDALNARFAAEEAPQAFVLQAPGGLRGALWRRHGAYVLSLSEGTPAALALQGRPFSSPADAVHALEQAVTGARGRVQFASVPL